MKTRFAVATVVGVTTAALLYVLYSGLLTPRATLRNARESMRSKQFEKAEQIAIEVSEADPSQERDALLLAIKAATSRSQYNAAWKYAERILELSEDHSSEDQNTAAELAFRSGQLRVSIEHYERSLERLPEQVEVRKRLVYLFGLTGRNFEAQAHLRWLLDINPLDIDTLLLLGAPDQVVNFGEVLGKIRDQNPKDPALQLALGRVALANLKNAEARIHLLAAIEAMPDSLEAAASLGQVEFEIKNQDNVLDWWKRVRDKQIPHPAYWIALGNWAKELKDYEKAYECFSRAATIDDNNGVVFYLLGEEHKRRQDLDASRAALERHTKLTELSRHCLSMYGRSPNASQMLKAAQLCQSLGRTKEAYSWYAIVSQGGGQPTSENRQTARAQQKLLAETPLEWSSYARPGAPKIAESKFDMTWFADGLKSYFVVDQLRMSQGVVFNDVAKNRALDFQYFTSPKQGAESRQLYEFAGGGAGVIDFDRDGWPDVILPQGCLWPPPQKPIREGDRIDSSGATLAKSEKLYSQSLFRNQSGQGWKNVAIASQVDYLSYGQGVACGDINNDGFDDVYIACIGQNILLVNNGDGTFDEVSFQMGIQDKSWTVSCAIADVNQDGLADIYDVNYLQGDDLFTRECIWEGNRIRICGPGSFEACSDRLWINNGSGFDERSREMGIVAPEGKGLGIMVGSFLHPHSNCIFIANDQTANHFYTRVADEELLAIEKQDASRMQAEFRNVADLLGVALDGSGTKQGCMGIAVGDFDKNGFADFFVTNYVTESNTLYSQTEKARFDDLTRRAMLREPSLSMVGFGTQAIDALLDGNLDLVVTNGHLDQFDFKGQAYEMPPQYFRNNGNGRFSEIAKDWNGYWSGKYLGRAMAKIDWNKDGREDLVVTHLDAPVALLENQSNAVGNSLTIRLVGRGSSRDSIGSQIKLFDGKTEQTQILMAGNGYECSNEKQLFFGLDQSDTAAWIEISWIGGKVERFESVKAGRWLAIEDLGIFPQ